MGLSDILLAMGVLAIAIEAAILGFSTLFLFFLGCGSILSGIAMKLAWIPVSVASASVSIGVISVLLALLLWRPMQRLQSSQSPIGQQSDLIGLRFELTSPLSNDTLSSHRYSGIVWSVKPAKHLDEPLPAGTQVVVTAVEVAGLYVIKSEEPAVKNSD